jgi:hypothetical protein
MALDKILQKIQGQINALAPTFELFVEDTIQPSVSDCENLQKQLHGLLENISVYKYHKQNTELSPSFNIHAKVSKVETPPQKTEPVKEIKETPKPKAEPAPTKAPVNNHVASNTIKPKLPLTVGINDKFRFINELFLQNSSEYNIAIEQINNLSTWTEGEIYLNSLKNIYGWKENNEAVKYFYGLVKKRFD